MKHFQPHLDFSAQAFSFRALILMYEKIESGDNDEYALLPLVVFAAFSIEAYINSIGSRMINFWDEIERLSWKKKINILHQCIGASPDWSNDPLQLAKELFSLRDRIAHGKPERVIGPDFKSHDEAIGYLLCNHKNIKPDWLINIDATWVISTKDRLIKLMSYLASLYQLPDQDFANHSQGLVTEHGST